MLCRFGHAALPKCDYLHKCVTDVLFQTSKDIMCKCREAYASLSSKVEQEIHKELYRIQQTTDFHHFESILSFHRCQIASVSDKFNRQKKKKLQKLMEESRARKSNETVGHTFNLPQVPRNKKKTRRFKRRPLDTKNAQMQNENTRLVVNLSTVKLTDAQSSVMALGPKFCPTPKSFNHQGMVQDNIREGCRLTRLKEYHHDRTGTKNQQERPKFYKKTGWCPPPGRDRALDAFCHILQNRAEAFTPTMKRRDNLSRAQRQALGELKELVKTRQIRISTADKGGATVIQDATDYIAEAARQLSNTNHYACLQTDPTKKIAQKSNQIVDDLLADGHISEQTQRWAKVNVSATKTHRFYTLPKIHKTLDNPPGRPIVSGTNGPTENLSKLVDDWLQQHVTDLPSYIKDSTHMLKTIEQWNLDKGPFPTNTKLVTIDVNALYTNIPHEEMKTAIRHYLETNPKPDIPPPDTVVMVADHVLANNVFQFEEQVYQQVFGTAMGTPLAPSAANLFMGWLERQLLDNSPVPIDQDTWKRFIDDIFLLWTGSTEELDTFINFINAYHPSIKFSVNSSEVFVPFLDIRVSLENGYLQTDLYSKPTDAHAYLVSSSCHPRHTIKNIPFSLFIRLRRLCSSDNCFQERCDELSKQLRKRGHSWKTINSAKAKVFKMSRTQCLQYQHRRKSSRVPFVLTHHPDNPPIRTWLHDLHKDMTDNSDRMKHAVPETPVVGERQARSLKTILMPSTLPPVPDPRPPGCYKCQASRCVMCRDHLVTGNSFVSQHTGEVFTHRHTFSCTSENIIYILWCEQCNCTQYVGETKTSLKQRFYKHYSDIRQNIGTYVTEHFNLPGHSINSMKCTPIEQILSPSGDAVRRRQRESFWMTKLNTYYPLGLNDKT
jgi:hypothetical protein